MRASTTAWLAATGLLATGMALGQIPGTRNATEGVPYAGAREASPTAAGAPARELPPPYITRQADLEIPFSVKPGSTPDNQPFAVRIFVSWDRGQAWHLYEEKKPTDGRFRFRPKKDGEFWFATQTVDRNGRTDSPEPRRPQLRLIVDTQKPQLLAQAVVGGSGEVSLSYSAADAGLVLESLKIEYQDAAGTGGTWNTVTPEPLAKTSSGQTTGRAVFEPQVPSRNINVRIEVADAAGNAAYYSQRLSLNPPRVPRLDASIAAAPPVDPSATPWTGDAPPADAPGYQNETMIVGNAPQPREITPEAPALPGAVANPYARQDRLTSTSSPSGGNPGELTPQPVEPITPVADNLPPPTEAPPSYSPPTSPEPAPSYSQPTYTPPTISTNEPPPGTDPLPSPETTGRPAYGEPPANPSQDGSYAPPEPQPSYPEPISPQPVAPEPSYSRPTPSYEPPTESIEAPSGQRPRLTNSRRFSLDYDVDSVGPEGLADVELWGTSDGGRSWAKWGADPDRKSPFDVEVAGEAAYGFRVVIVGKNGLASNAPGPGDTADIWVGIDLTRPTARLTGAAYGKGDSAGKLDIRWQAADANLAQRPVTLAISERPDGPFTPIAAGLPNNGHYLWEFDPASPRKIYLRLEVRDDAGNVTIDQLTEPISVEGLKPQGRIRGFVPAAETPRGAFRPQMFR